MSKSKSVRVTVNGRPLRVSSACSAAGAVYQAGYQSFRTSTDGQARAPLCGMGICFECRVTINGVPQLRSCQVPVSEGMEIVLD